MSRAPVRVRLLSRLLIDPGTGCLLWTGALSGKGASTERRYGHIWINGHPVGVHRVMYEMFAGPIPAGMTLDHLCRVPHCASPAHLEPVTNRVNILRGNSRSAQNARRTHCPRGHAYDEENTTVYRSSRYCRACRRKQVTAV